MTFTQHKHLTLSSPDSRNVRPDKSMIGKSYFHPKTRRIYRVSGFVWNSSTDMWDVRYSRSGCGIEFTRRIDEFKDGRFVEVDNSDPEEDSY